MFVHRESALAMVSAASPAQVADRSRYASCAVLVRESAGRAEQCSAACGHIVSWRSIWHRRHPGGHLLPRLLHNAATPIAPNWFIDISNSVKLSKCAIVSPIILELWSDMSFRERQSERSGGVRFLFSKCSFGASTYNSCQHLNDLALERPLRFVVLRCLRSYWQMHRRQSESYF